MTSIAILEAVNTSYVSFSGQQVITAMAAGVAYVAMKPIVENLGMSWPTQMRKLLNQKDKYGYVHMSIPSKGGIQQMLCLPLKKLNGWLFSINPVKVKVDIRDKLMQYQEECFAVLHDYWTKGQALNPKAARTGPAKFILTIRPDGTGDLQPITGDTIIADAKSMLSEFRERGWLVIRRDMLAEKIALL